MWHSATYFLALFQIKPAGLRQRCSRSRRLQALVYDILPSTTVVFSYVMGSRKLSANEQFCCCCCCCSNSSTFITNNSNKTRRVIYSRQEVYTSINKTTVVWIETELFFFFFLPWVDASHYVYVRALALGCFCSHISTGTFGRALTASLHGQLRGDKECAFSGVTKPGRVWRKVPESDARSVPFAQQCWPCWPDCLIHRRWEVIHSVQSSCADKEQRIIIRIIM